MWGPENCIIVESFDTKLHFPKQPDEIESAEREKSQVAPAAIDIPLGHNVYCAWERKKGTQSMM